VLAMDECHTGHGQVLGHTSLSCGPEELQRPSSESVHSLCVPGCECLKARVTGTRGLCTQPAKALHSAWARTRVGGPEQLGIITGSVLQKTRALEPESVKTKPSHDLTACATLTSLSLDPHLKMETSVAYFMACW
jgi:hypothetical protein